ncbi:alpha/beta fold hydrolase [Cryptosporangium sp. NPDC048952]|uniref:alpha/beta fold hydrolase n=1 Tax=Cryptosporangium sp. NPDC048952 TaxID=3363961 RepID=UPI003717EACE
MSESGTVESLDGTAIGYTRVGVGPPLVICHGSFAAAVDWLPVAHELAGTRTVYVYDRRGRASSPYASTGFAIDAEVDDLAAVVALAGPGAALLGHSFGGGCVLSFAARDRFPGPILVYEPRHSVDGPVSGGHIPEIRRLLATDDREAAVRTILEKVIGLPDDAVTAFAESPLWTRMIQTVDAFPDELRLLDQLTWRPGDLAGTTGPTWLLVGDRSPVLPADREGALRGVLPELRRVVLAGQGHFGYRTAPAVLARAVEECLGA